jgi:hypothetical protein
MLPPNELETVYLFVRKTTDWGNEAVFRAQLDPGFAPKVQTWNNTLSMPYHVFRARLCEIADATHGRSGGTKAYQWRDIPDGAIVLPTDDDDWFAPGVARHIAGAMQRGADGCLWTQSVVEIPINFMHRVNLAARKFIPAIGPKWLCATNNYAFRKKPGSERLIGHMGASKAFASDQMRSARLSERMSIHNRTLASITSLAFTKPTISAHYLRRKAKQYERLYRKPALASGLEWTGPYVRQMAELMRELAGG